MRVALVDTSRHQGSVDAVAIKLHNQSIIDMWILDFGFG